MLNFPGCLLINGKLLYSCRGWRLSAKLPLDLQLETCANTDTPTPPSFQETTPLWGSKPHDKGEMQQQKQVTMADLNKELADVQQETMKTISAMININVDTLETINRQIEQTEGDLRKLEGAQCVPPWCLRGNDVAMQG